MSKEQDELISQMTLNQKLELLKTTATNMAHLQNAVRLLDAYQSDGINEVIDTALLETKIAVQNALYIISDTHEKASTRVKNLHK